MKVYVVMGNDYPSAVFSTEATAKAYCMRKRAQDKRDEKQGYYRATIYWRTYEFEMDKEEKQ